MKSFQVSEDILPLGEFKVKAARVLRQMRDTQRPVVITQNGRPAAVLVSPAEFDRLTHQERFLASIRRGLADAEAGRLVDHDEVVAMLETEFGAADEE